MEDTSPTMYEADIDIPKGVRIEAYRYDKWWLCTVKGSTLTTVGGIVCGSDRVRVVTKLGAAGREVAYKVANWLRGRGHPVAVSVCV